MIKHFLIKNQTSLHLNITLSSIHMVTFALTCILKVRKCFKPVFGNIPGITFFQKMTGNLTVFVERFYLFLHSSQLCEQSPYHNYHFNGKYRKLYRVLFQNLRENDDCQQFVLNMWSECGSAYVMLGHCKVWGREIVYWLESGQQLTLILNVWNHLYVKLKCNWPIFKTMSSIPFCSKSDNKR